MTTPPAQKIGAAMVALATPFVVVAAAVLLFLNPIWVGFDQDRSDVTALTGYSEGQVRQVTGSILSDLVFGPPHFDAAVNGAPVLDERERSHMADVRTVLLDLGYVALVAAAVLLIAGAASRGAGWFWRGVRAGGMLTTVGVAVVGLGFVLFFEQAFQLFHELFFAAGSYTFDPSQEKLVQLFPDQFWSETSVAIAAAVLALALLVTYGAGRLVALQRGPEAAPVSGTLPAEGQR